MYYQLWIGNNIENNTIHRDYNKIQLIFICDSMCFCTLNYKEKNKTFFSRTENCLFNYSLAMSLLITLNITNTQSYNTRTISFISMYFATVYNTVTSKI